jgi:hypothetical protein
MTAGAKRERIGRFEGRVEATPEQDAADEPGHEQGQKRPLCARLAKKLPRAPQDSGILLAH